MAIEFAERMRRIPAYPVAAGYDLGADVAMLASNECCFAPLAAVVEAAARASPGRQPLPRPVLRAAARGAVGALRRRRRADRARQRLVRHPAGRRRGAARARRRGRLRVAGVQRLSPSGRRLGRARDRGAARRRRPPRPRRDGRRGDGRDPAGADLQPEQPDLDRARARRGRRVPAADPAPRVRDPRRGLLRVLAGARRHVRVGRAAAPLAEPGAAADVLEGLRARRRCASATRCAARRTSAPRSTRSASRSTSTPPRRRRRSRRCATRTRSSAGWPRRSPRASSWSTGCARWACGWPSPTRTSSGCTCPQDDVEEARRRGRRGLRERGVLVRAGAALGASDRCG